MSDMCFQTKITNDDVTGQLLSVYFRVRRGKVHETREFSNGAAFADYNKKGELIGIEMIGPCRVSIVDQLAANEPASMRTQTKYFLKQSAPRSMIAA